MTSAADNARRRLIGTGIAAAAGLAAAALAPGLRLIEASRADAPSAGASGKVRWGMLIDTTQCATGCTACVTACNAENGIDETIADARQGAQWIRKIDIEDPRSGHVHSLPMLCQHCADPPCVNVCPTGASLKRADGIVLVDRHSCIGCRYCMMACPFNARSFVHLPLTQQRPEVPRGVGCVESCTFCVQRIDRGLQPACVAACPQGAMTFGDLNDATSPLARRLAGAEATCVRADLGLDPGVRYRGI